RAGARRRLGKPCRAHREQWQKDAEIHARSLTRNVTPSLELQFRPFAVVGHICKGTLREIAHRERRGVARSRILDQDFVLLWLPAKHLHVNLLPPWSVGPLMRADCQRKAIRSHFATE